ncbi:hypothetical protein NQD34_018304 [Periophthalmus magnuspinnatus]|nr:hypothetical protein NQD34_018304 [Periophthalmus magnuspinnatus]
MAAVINLLIRERRQGIQQHPHKVKIATNTAIDTRTDETSALQRPNPLSQSSQKGVLNPDCSFKRLFIARRLPIALVRLPSAAVLLGMTTQQLAPITEQTPPRSARSVSTAMRHK